jgi:hypothetical protein
VVRRCLWPGGRSSGIVQDATGTKNDSAIRRRPRQASVRFQNEHARCGIIGRLCAEGSFPKRGIDFPRRRKSRQSLPDRSGTVSLEACYAPKSSVVVDIIGAGELLGLSWLFPPHRWRVSARACESTAAIVFIGAILREYSERDHSLGFQLFKRINEVMARRLEASRQRLLEFAAGHRTSHSDAPQHSAAYDDERRCE